MPKTRLLLAMPLAAVALGATTPVSSGDWVVNNTKLVGTAALASDAHVVSNEYLLLRREDSSTAILCTAKEVGIVGGELVAPSLLRIKALSFGECKGGGGCELASETLLTLPLRGLAYLAGFGPPYLQILPSTSKTVAVINFGSCGGGTVALLEAGPDIDILMHHESSLKLWLTSSLPGLELGSSPVSIARNWLELGLQSKQVWGFL